MRRSRRKFDSHRWTGEPDFVEVGALSLVFLFGAIAFLAIGTLAL
jgi:hypothetical protein